MEYNKRWLRLRETLYTKTKEGVMLRRNIILLIIVLFFIGCGGKTEIKENENVNENLEQKYEKIHKVKWQERQKQKGKSYTYRDYQKEETLKELDNPTYKIVSLKYCDIPVRNFVKLDSDTDDENKVWLYYFAEDFKNKLVQYEHTYSIVIGYEDKVSYLKYDSFYDQAVKKGKAYLFDKYEYEDFKISSYIFGPNGLYEGRGYYIHGNNTTIEIGLTTEKEIQYMIDYCNKTKKKEL